MPLPILAVTPNTSVGGIITAGATVVCALIAGWFTWVNKRRSAALEIEKSHIAKAENDRAASFREVMALLATYKADNEDLRRRMTENNAQLDENNARIDGFETELRILKAKLKSAEDLNVLAAAATEAHLARAIKAESDNAELQRQLADCIGRKGGQTRRSTDVLNGAANEKRGDN